MDLHIFLAIYGKTALPRLARATGKAVPAYYWQLIAGARSISYAEAKKIVDAHEHFDVVSLMESHQRGAVEPDEATAMRRARKFMKAHGIPGSPAGRMGPARPLDLKARVLNDRAKSLNKSRVLARTAV